MFVLHGSVLWVVCSRGFVSRSFWCWGFLASFLLCGCLVWILSRFHLDTDSNMAFFLLGHSMELCREVGGTHLWVLAVAILLVAVQFRTTTTTAALPHVRDTWSLHSKWC